MAETKETKKPVAKKPATPKDATSVKAAAKAAVPKSGKTIVVKQTGSPARSEDWAYQTLAGLGLGKINRVRELEDTPAVRGMVRRVRHLVIIQDKAA